LVAVPMLLGMAASCQRWRVAATRRDVDRC
jgi:hypothetical protein